MTYPPRKGDLPRIEAMRRANELASQGWRVNFKFTCEKCGERCILIDGNTLWEYGECCACGHKTKLDYVGFTISKVVE